MPNGNCSTAFVSVFIFSLCMFICIFDNNQLTTPIYDHSINRNIKVVPSSSGLSACFYFPYLYVCMYVWLSQIYSLYIWALKEWSLEALAPFRFWISLLRDLEVLPFRGFPVFIFSVYLYVYITVTNLFPLYMGIEIVVPCSFGPSACFHFLCFVCLYACMTITNYYPHILAWEKRSLTALVPQLVRLYFFLFIVKVS